MILNLHTVSGLTVPDSTLSKIWDKTKWPSQLGPYILFQLDRAYIPVTIFQFDPPIFQEYSRNSSMRLLLRQPLTAHRIAKTAKNRQKSSQISRERKAQPCSRAFQAEWALSLMTPSPISKLMSKLFHQHLEYVKNMYVLAATRM